MVEINRLPTDHRLDKIGVCLACGNPNRPDNELTRDHYFPKDLLNIPRGLREKHPFWNVIHNRHNWYSFCWEDHCDIEEWKRRALRGDHYTKFDPLTLARRMVRYPITTSIYREQQIANMIEINGVFIAVATSLNGELKPDLKKNYEKAAQALEKLNRKLKQI